MAAFGRKDEEDGPQQEGYRRKAVRRKLFGSPKRSGGNLGALAQLRGQQ